MSMAARTSDRAHHGMRVTTCGEGPISHEPVNRQQEDGYAERQDDGLGLQQVRHAVGPKMPIRVAWGRRRLQEAGHAVGAEPQERIRDAPGLVQGIGPEENPGHAHEKERQQNHRQLQKP